MKNAPLPCSPTAVNSDVGAGHEAGGIGSQQQNGAGDLMVDTGTTQHGLVSQLLDENKARVKVLSTADKWYGVTYKEDKPVVVNALTRMRQEGLYPMNLWND